MNDLIKRLQASVRFDAVNGDRHERAVCKKQMDEAASALHRQEIEIAELACKITESNTDRIAVSERLSLAEKLIGDIRDNATSDIPEEIIDRMDSFLQPNSQP